MFSVRDFYYNIWRSENVFHVPKQSTDYLKRSHWYLGAVLWNGLPSELRKLLTLTRFKKGSNNLYSSTGTHTEHTSTSTLDFNYHLILTF